MFSCLPGMVDLAYWIDFLFCCSTGVNTAESLRIFILNRRNVKIKFGRKHLSFKYQNVQPIITISNTILRHRTKLQTKIRIQAKCLGNTITSIDNNISKRFSLIRYYQQDVNKFWQDTIIIIERNTTSNLITFYK